ncbi:transcription elongation factor Spt5 [Candidatus Pacearchaeota archaeon CG_4_9_14_3_um_filter_31_7]|nr:MAG: transcription elongation factor Spt5 [Candidatus Pacearchaeota archaeon CG1_02_31_27]PIN92330.1 MAG: transcription elongation factor Spt5 [Candidatus Pacearchaeota archaeon CG10_big_fil_rev_8_21_14_0_10_31_59]PIZ79998.1 MAG: transcription elongation factor Spt5 [Candidatus Pacearchaeota archaeon CG_4_10_14_0_2_um_filter_31_10]PJA70571.1 MAG: transcription elongation factor Spt5 [Candidatus Pacearchaeota archaeon CG_4_9_14_3_um_filter_31_7]
MLFTVKVSTNKEEQATDLLAAKAEKKGLKIFSLAKIHGLRGYIFMEAEDHETAEIVCYNTPYVKGVINKKVDLKDIENLIEPSTEQINIQEGDIVEIIAEPFKRDKAKVMRVDKQKGEAIVELLEATVPIPTTIKIDNLKVIRRESEESVKDKEVEDILQD